MIVRFLLGLFLVLSSLFLILLVLIQRGRGGGLAGAFGGAGGQSAFGTKAGDVFTKITVGVAGFWILLCILSFNILGRTSSKFDASALGTAAPIGTGNAPVEGAAPAAGAGDAAGTPATAEAPDAPGAAAASPESGTAAEAPAPTDDAK